MMDHNERLELDYYEGLEITKDGLLADFPQFEPDFIEIVRKEFGCDVYAALGATAKVDITTPEVTPVEDGYIVTYRGAVYIIPAF